jgi:hypothetical protein
MRIAYLTEWSPYVETGVLRKMIGQLATWRALGHQAELFCLTPRQDRVGAIDFDLHGQVVGALPQSALERFPQARLGYVNKLLSCGPMAQALRAFVPDVIYYRQNGPWYPGISGLLRLAPSIHEINTDLLAESHVWGRAFNLLYRATQDRVLGAAAGFVAVTGEIALPYRRLGVPVHVIPNSMWTDPITFLDPARNAAPAFVFVGSRITGTLSWHGVDKIPVLARAMPNSRFDIIGHDPSDFGGVGLPSNMILHGELGSADVVRLIRDADIGIGTLALHRKAMNEACPLKVREYLSQRLPVILGYTEAEARLNHADFVLNLPNTETNISEGIEQIAAFAKRWHGRRVEVDLGFMAREGCEQRRLAFMGFVCHA